MKPDIAKSYRVESTEQAMVLLHPLRGEILAHMQEPVSAAEIARIMGDTPQRINYHLKALEKVGLIRRVGTRQVRNLVEVLFQSIARTFVLSDSLGLGQETLQKLKDHSSLAGLVEVAERIKRDASLLMERESAEPIPNAAVQSTVLLADAKRRELFLQEYVALVQQLAAKYQKLESGQEHAETFQLVLAVYPQPEKGGTYGEG